MVLLGPGIASQNSVIALGAVSIFFFNLLGLPMPMCEKGVLGSLYAASGFVAPLVLSRCLDRASTPVSASPVGVKSPSSTSPSDSVRQPSDYTPSGPRYQSYLSARSFCFGAKISGIHSHDVSTESMCRFRRAVASAAKVGLGRILVPAGEPAVDPRGGSNAHMYRCRASEPLWSTWQLSRAARSSRPPSRR